MRDELTGEWNRDAQDVQTRIWRQKTPSEKIHVVNQLWHQARMFKEATLRSLHPDWTEGQITEALWEAMSGRKRESL